MAQKWEFNSVYLRNKKKRISFRLTGRRSASRPTAEAGLARIPACRAFLPGQQRFAGLGQRRGRSHAQPRPPSPPARPPRGGRALPRSARVRAASRGTARGWAGEARGRRGRGPGRLRPWAGKLSGGLLSEMKFFSFYFSNKQN